MKVTFCALLLFLLGLAQAHGDVVFLLEEPYGHLGSWNPTGHAAVYLTRVCAASPTRLRRCEPGEPGVVISRYHKIAGYDWIAIPLIPYLYAVSTVQEIPKSVNAESVAELRDSYRREYLTAIAPDDANGRAPKGDWYQLVGSAYDRTLYGFLIATKPEQDDAFIEAYNNRANITRYSLLRRNCADFTAEVINFYAPHAIHSSLLADAGITTPKQVAKSLVAYSKRHPEVSLSRFKIPQVSGEIHRSKPADGVVEGLLKTKKYVLPLTLLQPYVTVGLAATYLTEGRFTARRNLPTFDIARQIESSTPSVFSGLSTAASVAPLPPVNDRDTNKAVAHGQRFLNLGLSERNHAFDYQP